MISLSIIVPTLNKHLKLNRLLLSIYEQSYPDRFEILICAKVPDLKKFLVNLPPSPSHISNMIIPCEEPGIGNARNRGIDAASGKYLLFLDDDCIIPDKNYISNILKLINTRPHDGFCGTYIDLEDTQFLSAFYNHLSNLWLMSYFKNDKLHMLIGGCFLVSQEQIAKNNARFNDLQLRAGEENTFAAKLIQSNTQINFEYALSVFHDTQCSLSHLLKKSWIHGQALVEKNEFSSQNKISSFVRALKKEPVKSLIFLPTLLLFLLVGRMSLVVSKIDTLFLAIYKACLKHN